jgi:hypothetical protein
MSGISALALRVTASAVSRTSCSSAIARCAQDIARRTPGHEPVPHAMPAPCRYMQQLLKLGAAEALPGLTEHFILWDVDMVPLCPFQLFFDPAKPGGPPQTRLDVADSHYSEYEYSYRALFGAAVEYPGPRASYVAHWMLMYKCAPGGSQASLRQVQALAEACASMCWLRAWLHIIKHRLVPDRA